MTSAYDYITVANSIVNAILLILVLIFKRESLGDLLKPRTQPHATAKRETRSTTRTIHALVHELATKVDRLTPEATRSNDSSPESHNTPPRGPLTVFDV